MAVSEVLAKLVAEKLETVQRMSVEVAAASNRISLEKLEGLDDEMLANCIGPLETCGEQLAFMMLGMTMIGAATGDLEAAFAAADEEEEDGDDEDA